MSIRLRLTLLNTALVVLVVLAFGATLYVGHSRQTLASIQNDVVSTARRLAGGREPWHRPGGAPLPPVRSPADYVQIRAEDGSLVERTSNLGESELPLPAGGLVAVQDGQTWSEVVTLDDERLLVVSSPVWSDGYFAGVVQVAGSLELTDAYLGRLRTNLLFMTLAAVIVAFAGGWILAGAVLQPIERITTTAQAIGAERDFSRRVVHTGPDDELGRLSRTFNEMLEALEAAYVGLEASLQRQRRFVADASHELRTPLTTIRGNSELLLLHPPIQPADRDAAVRDTIDETDRLIGLVNDLLALARADAGRKPAREPVPIRPLLDDLRRQVQVAAPGRDVTFVPAPDVAVLGDRGAVKQILLNLVENAIKHTPPSTAITVSAAVEGDRATLTVRDAGPGIAPDLLPHVFERFRRGDTARTSPGSGLGLSIAQALVEAQDGSIAVESNVGLGSTFIVDLPLAEPEPARSGGDPDRQ